MNENLFNDAKERERDDKFTETEIKSLPAYKQLLSLGLQIRLIQEKEAFGSKAPMQMLECSFDESLIIMPDNHSSTKNNLEVLLAERLRIDLIRFVWGWVWWKSGTGKLNVRGIRVRATDRKYDKAEKVLNQAYTSTISMIRKYEKMGYVILKGKEDRFERRGEIAGKRFGF